MRCVLSQPDPVVLGFDTSGPYCGAALFRDQDVPSALYEDMVKGQAERLMPMIDEVLSDSGTSLNDLDAIGVGIGPGNFTGIRICVSAARGLALSLGIPAIGVTTLEAAAFATEGPRLIAHEARQGRAYVQGFGGVGPSSPEIRQVHEIAAETPPDTPVIGSAAADVLRGTDAYPAPSIYAPASAIARIAALRLGQDNPPPAPLYIRPPDAAPMRDALPKILP